ncbi:Zona pellucida-like domain containing protein 7, partial [Leptotrombidium deliense]
VVGQNENWNLESGWTKESISGIGKLNALDVICGKDHMTVRAEFNGPFQGIVFSKGTYGQDNCVYIKPYSGTTHATFKVKYDECGTKPDLQGKYYENTIVIQYGTDIIEAWDEAKRLRCEWFEAYEKPATFRPAIPVADLDVVEMNFQGDDIDCWMEIQEGKGPWGREVSRIVPVGQPMTIVIAINDYQGQFDMRVKSCFAHDGVKPPIHLTDEYGCVLRQKMLTPFNKVRDSNGRATIISYSHFYAFKFPDSMNVQIQCTVEVCRHGCPDACQKGSYPPPHREIHPKINFGLQNKPAANRPENDALIGHKTHDNEAKQIGDDDMLKQASQQHPNHQFDIHRLPLSQAINDTEFEKLEIKKQVVKSPEDEKPESRPAVDDHNIAEESNPVVKVMEIDLTADQKKPIISEQTAANISPDDMKHASKFLTDLGINVDLNNLASNVMSKLQNKDITSLLRDEKLKELALASGIKLHRGEQIPKPQSLVGNAEGNTDEQNSPITDVKHDNEVYESHRLPASELPKGHILMNETKNEFLKPAAANEYTRHTQNAVDQHSQVKQPPLIRATGMNPRPFAEMPLDASNPVVQVMNIPLQLGMPPIQLPAVNNFIAQRPTKPQRPSLFSAFQLPKLNFPFMSKNEVLQPPHIDGRFPQRFTNEQHNMVAMAPFPHGPRSFRHKRSHTGPEISVTKQFQVVTSIDLSFAPNVTTDTPQVFEGRREDVANGFCIPFTSVILALCTITSLVVCAMLFSVCVFFRINGRRNKPIYK